MKRDLRDGYEVDDDPERIDVAAVHRYISEESYWAPGRAYEHQERMVRTEHRGRGLGVELIAEMVEGGPYADRAWFLHTGDAHGLYEKFGFGKPGPKLMERPPAA